MLVPYNFKDGKFEKTAAATHAEKGIVCGAIMALTRRITVDFEKGKDKRKDIQKGEHVSIKGFVDDDKAVVEFEAVFGKITLKTDVAIKLSNLEFPCKLAAAASKASVSKMFDTYPYLNKEGDSSDVTIVDKWWLNLMQTDAESRTEVVKGAIKFTLDNLWHCSNDYGPEDLLIVKRGSSFEVWTKRAFKPHEIMFIPDTTEIKPRFYTCNRSAIAKNTIDPSSTDKRPFVLDGRVRGNPAPDSKSKFTLFWVVQRAEKDEHKLINMQLEYTRFEVNASVTIGDKVIPQKWASDELPSIPVMLNPNKVAAHTRLLAKEDKDIKDLYEKQQKQVTKGEPAKDDASGAAASSSDKAPKKRVLPEEAEPKGAEAKAAKPKAKAKGKAKK